MVPVLPIAYDDRNVRLKIPGWKDPQVSGTNKPSNRVIICHVYYNQDDHYAP